MIRFYNGRVLTFEPEAKIRQCEVWTDGEIICHVGAAPEAVPEFEREIDLNGDLLIPGFKNAHTHSGMTFLRSLADDMPLDKWLSEQVWPKEARLSPDGLYVMTRLAIMEYLTSGITSCQNILNSPAPSILAASITASFIICSINCFMRYSPSV